jgi:galactokinase
VIDPERLARSFVARFGRPPRIARAPGRVNLIGEHTDYNDGFVMPMALDRATWVAAAPRDDRTIVVRSEDYDETTTFDLSAPLVGSTRHWSDYIRGVAMVLDRGHHEVAQPFQAGAPTARSMRGGVERCGRRAESPAPHSVPGADMLIASDVPIGAGLASSAALEVACAAVLADGAGVTMGRAELARLCQRAEHEFAGTRCGIMDQMIACFGRAGHALLLDTRTLEHRDVPMPTTVRVLVCHTMVRHELASGEYNRRRADCEAGVAALRRADPSVRALRDATLEQLDEVRGDLSQRIYARCHHVITENDRVGRAAAAIERGDFCECGALMAASHASLRDDYEVSCDELDVMVDSVTALDGVFGARMTGGGFGGCVVALAEASRATGELCDTIRDRYESSTGRRPDVWIATAGDGVSMWSPVRV